MGEYAFLDGVGSVKIGTCEDMYYLRADQANQVRFERGNVNPMTDAEQIRFRFPFPQEDDVRPGEFKDAFLSLGLYGIEPPKEIDHDSIQFRNDRGLLTSLPCPEGEKADKNIPIHYNGYSGKVHISQQRLVEGKLVLVCECGSCGAKYRVPTLEDAKPILDALEEKAKLEDHQNRIASQHHGKDFESRGGYFREVARRIVAGYTEPNLWTKAQVAA